MVCRHGRHVTEVPDSVAKTRLYRQLVEAHGPPNVPLHGPEPPDKLRPEDSQQTEPAEQGATAATQCAAAGIPEEQCLGGGLIAGGIATATPPELPVGPPPGLGSAPVDSCPILRVKSGIARVRRTGAVATLRPTTPDQAADQQSTVAAKDGGGQRATAAATAAAYCSQQKRGEQQQQQQQQQHQRPQQQQPQTAVIAVALTALRAKRLR